MKQTIQAVTVSKNYLERKRWCVKLLSIETRKSGEKWWKVRATVATSENHDLMVSKAGLIAAQQGIPYIPDVYNGYNLTIGCKEELSKYGVTV